MGGGDWCGGGMLMTSSGKDIYSQLCFLHKSAVNLLFALLLDSHLILTRFGWSNTYPTELDLLIKSLLYNFKHNLLLTHFNYVCLYT